MKSRVGLVSSLFLAVTLSACNGQPQPTPTQATATEVPSATTAPVQGIETPTATRVATVEPTEAIAATTPTFVATNVIPTPATMPSPLETWSSTSPDGKWVAEGVTGSTFRTDRKQYYHVQLRVAKTDGSVEWIVIDEYYERLLGYTLLKPYRWSKDGQYFYFKNQISPDGCSWFANVLQLRSVNLADGHIIEIMPPNGVQPSLSPDETTLAYVKKNRGRPDELAIRELSTATEQLVTIETAHKSLGNIVWSPDATKFVLTLTDGPCGIKGETFSVVRIETTSLQQITLIDHDPRLLVTIEWPEPNKALLQDKDGNFWWLNPTTGELAPKEN